MWELVGLYPPISSLRIQLLFTVMRSISVSMFHYREYSLYLSWLLVCRMYLTHKLDLVHHKSPFGLVAWALDHLHTHFPWPVEVNQLSHQSCSTKQAQYTCFFLSWREEWLEHSCENLVLIHSSWSNFVVHLLVESTDVKSEPASPDEDVSRTHFGKQQTHEFSLVLDCTAMHMCMYMLCTFSASLTAQLSRTDFWVALLLTIYSLFCYFEQ